jgi:hypothetical protein
MKIKNFTAAKEPDYFKQQIEEMHATLPPRAALVKVEASNSHAPQ